MFEQLLIRIDTLVTNYVIGIWNVFHTQGNDLVTGAAVLFVTITGYLLLSGRISMTYTELLNRIWKFGLVLTFLLFAGPMETFVYGLLKEGPEAIGNWLLAAQGLDINNANSLIDDIWSKGIDASETVWDTGGWRNVGPYFLAAIIAFVTLSLTIVTSLIAVLTKIAVAVLLALGPFFILSLFFESTKAFFDGWIKQVLTFALLPVLLYSVIGLLFSICDAEVQKLVDASKTGGVIAPSIYTFSLISFVCVGIMKLLPTWTAGIVGGFALQTSAGVDAFKNRAGKEASRTRQQTSDAVRNRIAQYRNRKPSNTPNKWGK